MKIGAQIAGLGGLAYRTDECPVVGRVPSRGACPCLASVRSGYLLIECLIYIAVLAVVMGLAFSAFYRSLDNSRDLGRNAEDILRALSAGELWRKDVRAATAPLRLISEGDLTACEIQKRAALVVYIFDHGAIWRKEGSTAPRELLPRVKSSLMAQDRRERVSSWRWELELATKKKGGRLRPLFTFQAVPSIEQVP